MTVENDGALMQKVDAAAARTGPQPGQLKLFGSVGRPATLPLTRDGLPDLVAMRASGLDHEADVYLGSVKVVAELVEAQARAEYGDRRTAVRAVALRNNISLRTAYRRLETAEKGGPAALVPDWHSRDGDTVLPETLQKAVLDFYLDQRGPTFAQVHRAVVMPHYASDGRQCPTVGCVRRFIRARVDPLTETVFRRGAKAYAQAMQPRVTRELPAVGSVWSCDHRLLDVVVLDRSEPGKERPVRPWLTAIWDVGSAALVGCRLVDRPTSDAVAHALFSALLNWGTPDTIQTDNDKTYTARRFGGKRKAGTKASLPEGADDPGIWAALGIRLTRALPYNAPSKPPESFFAALSRLEENLLPGSCGRSPSDKPEALKSQIERGNVLTWEEHEAYFADLVRRWNHEHVCGDRSAPPGRLYADAPPRKRWDASSLAFLLQRKESCRVHPQGVQIAGRWYWEPEHLPLYVGQTIEVRFDPAMPDFAFGYADGRSITLTPKPFGNWDDPKSEAVLLAKRGARLQRQHVAQLAAAVKGTAPIEATDPTGTFRMVRDRKLAERAEQKALTAMLTDAQVAATIVTTPAFPHPDWARLLIYQERRMEEVLCSYAPFLEDPDAAPDPMWESRAAALRPLVTRSFEAHALTGAARENALADLASVLAEPAVKDHVEHAPAAVLRHFEGLGILPLPTTGRAAELIRERRKAARTVELAKAEPGIFPRTSTDWSGLVKLIALTEGAPLVPLFQEIGAADALADAGERDAALARLGARLRQADSRRQMRKLPVNVKRAIKATGLTLGKVWDSPCGEAIRAAELEIKKEVAHAA